MLYFSKKKYITSIHSPLDIVTLLVYRKIKRKKHKKTSRILKIAKHQSL